MPRGEGRRVIQKRLSIVEFSPCTGPSSPSCAKVTQASFLRCLCSAQIPTLQLRKLAGLRWGRRPTSGDTYDRTAPDHEGQRLRRRLAGRLSGDDEHGAVQPPFLGIRQDHLGNARPFLGSARQEVHRLRRALRSRKRNADRSRARAGTQAPLLRKAFGEGEGALRERDRALDDVGDPAWRAGSAQSLRLALPHPARSGRTGICRQPGARRGASCDGLREICAVALRQAAALRRDACGPSRRDGQRERGLQEDRRHAASGRGACDGYLRDLLQHGARS